MISRASVIRFFENTLWLAGGQAARVAAGMVTAVIVARYLGVAQFGMLSFATVFVNLFAAITGTGLERLMLRELVEHADEQGRILGSAIVLRFFSGLITATLALLIVPFVVESADGRLLVYIVLGGILLGFPGISGAYFSVRLESRVRVTVSTIAVWGAVASKCLLVTIGASVAAFAVVDALTVVVSAFVIFLLMLRRSGLKLSYSLATMQRLARRAGPMVLIGVLYALQLRIDQVMISRFLGAEALGLYAAALKPHELLMFIPSIVATTAVPALVRSRLADIQLFQQRLRLVYTGLAILAWPLVLGIFTLAPSIITLLFGDAFAGAADALRVHIWALLFAFVDVGRAQWSLAEGQQRVQAGLLAAAVLIKVLLNLVLIPRLGIVGASLAMVLTIVLYSIVGPLLVNPGQRQQAIMMLRALFLLDARLMLRELWMGWHGGRRRS